MSRPNAYSYLRMSTDVQMDGDSFRRQQEAARKYADDNGLDLAEEAEFDDIGVSAFDGANVNEGAF